MSAANPKELTPKEAHDRLDDFRIVDVRFDHEMDGPLGSIAGAERIDRADLPARVEALKNEPLLVVCRSGRRSAAACEKLSALGHTDVTNLAGGMIAWNEAGLPAERTPAPSVSELARHIACWFGMMIQAPEDDARRELGLDAGDTPTHDGVRRAIGKAHARLEGDAAPPDLTRSIHVFRADLARLDQSGA